MTAIEAWGWLAKVWAESKDSPLVPLSNISITKNGLCYAIEAMVTYRVIDMSVYRTMESHINEYAPPRFWTTGYCWPRGEREPRAEFCLKMVEILKPKSEQGG